MKFIKHILIPLILFSISVVLLFSEYEREKIGLFTTVEHFGAKKLEGILDKELYKTDKVIGNFTASENNMGTIAVRFNTFWRINDDWIIFRIKEANSLEWYYQNIHKVDQFQNRQMFPFGFPEITDSKNKPYVFEIESSTGSTASAVAVDSKYPSFQVRYRFPKEYIFNFNGLRNMSVWKVVKYNLTTIISYLIQKFSVQFSEIDKSIITLTYFTPLLFYLFSLYKKQLLLRLLLTVFTLLDVFLVNEIKDISTTILFFGWGCLFLSIKIPVKVTFIVSTILLFMSASLYYLPETVAISDKAGSWSLIFLLFSFYNFLISSNKNEK